MKLGKIEKFILRYLWYYNHDPDYNHVYRSQLVYSLYSIPRGNRKFGLNKNIKDIIPLEEYNRLQASVTRSTKSLEKKGLIEKERLSEDYLARRKYFRKRKFKFFLTELGKMKSKELSKCNPIKTISDVFL